MEAIETKTNGNLRYNIHYDESPGDPRSWDNVGTIVCFHKRYNLGDKTDLKRNDFASFDELETYIKQELKGVIILPVFMMDHSGISISTKDFNDRWDSGQIGFIYTTQEKMDENKFDVDTFTKILVNEVHTYNKYLNGECYMYIIEEQCTHCDMWKQKETIGGFYELKICRDYAEEAIKNV